MEVAAQGKFPGIASCLPRGSMEDSSVEETKPFAETERDSDFSNCCPKPRQAVY